ncbi:MAG: 50S ribosomal protein L23 [Chromatiales bacterium 21-64-14]|nr:MAG: 50S ribosomal protein L23 [Chromatiales bacterium 21-64-14]
MSAERLMKVLLAPVVSEKASRLSDRHRQFVFQVVTDATKPEVKQAVELMFQVKVSGVQIANVQGKAKRSGQRTGRRSNWKKAYVTLEPGHDIDFMEAR